MKDRTETVNSYISDMLSLEEHIAKALTSQLQDLADYPTVTTELRSILGTVEEHATGLKQLLDRRGGQAASPLKRAGSTLLGWGAGVVDLVRKEGLPKNLRDDYTACSLAAIGYNMLYTTGLSVGEREVADLALRHLRDHARVVMTLHNLIPAAVIRFLQEEGLPAREDALEEIGAELEQTWRDQAGTVPEADEMPVPGGATR